MLASDVMRAGAEMVFACSDTLNAKHVSNGLLVLYARSLPLLPSRLVLSSLAFRMSTIYEIIVFIFVCSLFGSEPIRHNQITFAADIYAQFGQINRIQHAMAPHDDATVNKVISSS